MDWSNRPIPCLALLFSLSTPGSPLSPSAYSGELRPSRVTAVSQRNRRSLCWFSTLTTHTAMEIERGFSERDRHECFALCSTYSFSVSLFLLLAITDITESYKSGARTGKRCRHPSTTRTSHAISAMTVESCHPTTSQASILSLRYTESQLRFYEATY
jgi:hypothetical protein